MEILSKQLVFNISTRTQKIEYIVIHDLEQMLSCISTTLIVVIEMLVLTFLLIVNRF